MNGLYDWKTYATKQFFRHNDTGQIVFLVVYQGPATTVADYMTHECENYKNSERETLCKVCNAKISKSYNE